MKDLYDLLIKAKNSWEKKKGLIISMIAILGLHFVLLKKLIKEGNPNIDFLMLNFWIPIILLLILLIIWLIDTNRIPLPKQGDLTVALFLQVDEEESEKKIKKIAKDSIDELNSNYNNINFIIHPINKIKSEKDLNLYIEKNPQSIDTAILAKVNSGKVKDLNGNTDEILEIIELTFSGKFNMYKKFNLFKTSVSLLDELTIRNINKNWSFIDSNSFKDKIKIKSNLQDSILFYCGIYLLYLEKPNLALNILKTLRNEEDSKFVISHKERKIIGNERFIAAARLNNILLNLFIRSSSRLYEKKKIKEAYLCLKECESIFGIHPLSFEHNISLARFSYELGETNEAKEYTHNAKKIRPYATEINLNEGFFGIIEGDEESVYENYLELSKVYIHKNNLIGFTEVISFLENEKNSTSKSNLLFEFAIGTLNLFYSDKKLGQKILNGIYSNKLKKEYPKIYKLTNQFLTKGSTKSTYHKRDIKKKRKKKRRK